MDNFWQSQHEYTLHDAAFLWQNKDPQVKIPDSDRITSVVLTMLISATCSSELEVTGGLVAGLTIRSAWMQTESRIPAKITNWTRVSRESLIALAEKKGVKPNFFLPVEQVAEGFVKNNGKDAEPVEYKETLPDPNTKSADIHKAMILVNKLIAGKENVTRGRVMQLLGDNGLGYHDSKTFKTVWKEIPQTVKSGGGRPPKTIT